MLTIHQNRHIARLGLLLALVLAVASGPTATASTALAAAPLGLMPPAPALDYSVSLPFEPYDIALDRAGSVYVTGIGTCAPPDSQTNDYNSEVAKLSADGRRVLWRTCLGGSGQDEGYGIAVDAQGFVYVTGRTNSSDFPTAHASQPAYGGGPFTRSRTAFDQGDGDAFVAKLAPDGALVYSTFLGGSNSDFGWTIAVDTHGNAVVAGETESTDFPTMQPLQPAAGGKDAFVAKLASDGGLVSSTLVGGSGNDRANSVAFDSAGAAYVLGRTNSPDFQLTPLPGVPETSNSARWRGFVVKLAPDGSSMVYRAGLGQVDSAVAITVDAAGSAFIAATVTPPAVSNWGVRSDYVVLYTTVMKLAPDGQSLIYRAVFGNAQATERDSGQVVATDLVVDADGTAVVVGTTSMPDFPTPILPAGNLHGNTDLFVVRLAADGQGLDWGTRVGGSEREWYATVALDRQGRAVLAVSTFSLYDFPVTYTPPWSGDYASDVVMHMRLDGPPFPIPIAQPQFAELWAWSDLPLVAGAPGLQPRPWAWGQPLTHGLPNAFAPDDVSNYMVQLFEKGGMAYFESHAPRNLWEHAGLRLVADLIDPPEEVFLLGKVDITPCEEAVAGDPAAVNPDAVTYRSLRAVAYPVNAAASPQRTGELVTAVLDKDGGVSDDPSLTRYGVMLGGYDMQLGHNLPQVFLDFAARRGLVVEHGQRRDGRVVGDWLAIVGLPLAEPYWTRTRVGGVEKDVLVQPFERRLLTYTPDNPPGWRVEFGNVGRHYLACYFG